MNHWTELTELESAIIRVGEFKNLFKLLVAGAENDVDMKVLQSSIYTLEGMIDDIDSTLYEKFQTVWDSVRDEAEDEDEYEDEDEEPEIQFQTMYDPPKVETISISALDPLKTIQPLNLDGSTTSYAYDKMTPEEDDAFKELEKAMANWHKKASK